jgi:hypothetical protein
VLPFANLYIIFCASNGDRQEFITIGDAREVLVRRMLSSGNVDGFALSQLSPCKQTIILYRELVDGSSGLRGGRHECCTTYRPDGAPTLSNLVCRWTNAFAPRLVGMFNFYCLPLMCSSKHKKKVEYKFAGNMIARILDHIAKSFECYS